MKLIMTLFLYPLMNHTNIWDGINVLVFVGYKTPTVDLNATSNYENFPMDTNDDKYHNYQLSTTDD